MKKTILRTALASSLVLGGVGAYTITTLASGSDLPETYESENLIEEMVGVIDNEDGTFIIDGIDAENVKVFEYEDEDGIRISSVIVTDDESFDFENFNFSTYFSTYDAEGFSKEVIDITKNEDGTFSFEGIDEDNVLILHSEDEDGTLITSIRIAE